MSESYRHPQPVARSASVAYLLLLCSALMVVGSVVSSAFAAPAPVVDAAAQGPAMQAMEQRIKRLESRIDNQGLMEMIKQVNSLQRELQRLVGEVEVHTHELKGIQKRQREVYSDLDTRLRKLEQLSSNPSLSNQPLSGQSPLGGGSSVPITPATGLSGQQGILSSPTQAQPVDPLSEVDQNVARSAYERAFNMLKQGQYDVAISLFDAFLETYPTASYADNAQYWVGEANYAKRNYKVALAEFKKVIDQYPNSPKRADALLKMGYTYGELGDKRSALQTLNTIVNLFPESTAARLAKKRIQSFNDKQ